MREKTLILRLKTKVDHKPIKSWGTGISGVAGAFILDIPWVRRWLIG